MYMTACVCMYVMYVRTYVCMGVCEYTSVCEVIGVYIYIFIDAWSHAYPHTYVCMSECMCVRMYVGSYQHECNVMQT